MLNTTGSEPVPDEEVWRGWVQRGKRRENATQHRRKMAAAMVAVLVTLGSVIYLLVIR